MGLVVVALSLLGALPAMAQSAPIIRTSDEVEVSIPSASRVQERILAVDRTGEIDLAEYGRVEVAGLTEAEAREAVASQLSPYLRETSSVDVRLHRRIRHVLVTGQVLSAGLRTIEGEPEVWIAIQQSGGALPGADLSRVRVFRDGAEVPMDVHAYLTGTLTEPLPELLSGDTIFVPAAAGLPTVTGSATVFLSDEALRTRVFVLGAVESPGVFERMPGLNPLTALALAGGATPLADLANARLISPDHSDRVDLEALILGTETPVPIQEGAGVILFVPERAEQGAPNPFGQQVRLLGRSAFQGTLNVSGRVRLIDLLGDAGGFAPDADVDEVFVIRQGDRSSLALHYELGDYLHEGGAVGSVWVHPGDVVFIDVLPENTPWQAFVGGVRDLAIVSSAVLLWMQVSGAL